VPEGEAAFHRRVWRHRVGPTPAATSWSSARAGRRPSTTRLRVSLDGRWLLVGAAAGTAPRNDLYIADLAGDGDPPAGSRRASTPRPTAGSGPTAACTCTPTWTRPGSGSRSLTRPGRSRRPGATWCPSPRRPRGLRPDRRRPGGGVQPHAVGRVAVHDRESRRPAGRGRACRARGRCWACRPVPRAATRSSSATPTSPPRRACTATRSPRDGWSCGWTPPGRSTCWPR
jgi:hypothetical protein